MRGGPPVACTSLLPGAIFILRHSDHQNDQLPLKRAHESMHLIGRKGAANLPLAIRLRIDDFVTVLAISMDLTATRLDVACT